MGFDVDELGDVLQDEDRFIVSPGAGASFTASAPSALRGSSTRWSSNSRSWGPGRPTRRRRVRAWRHSRPPHVGGPCASPSPSTCRASASSCRRRSPAPCCGSLRLSKLGEDVTETLEVIPRSWKVIQTVREKFTCRSCEAIAQPPAPFHVTPRGFMGPDLLATILFEKFGQHQPLNRQSERYAREGIDLFVSTLADQVSAASAALKPLHDLIAPHVSLQQRLCSDTSHRKGHRRLPVGIAAAHGATERSFEADERGRFGRPLGNISESWLERKNLLPPLLPLKVTRAERLVTETAI